MPRLTTPQRDKARLKILQLYLLNVRDNAAICDYLREKENIILSPSQVWRYLAEVKKEMKRSAKFDRDEEIGKAKGQLENLFQKCVQDNKFQTALGVRRELSELLGIKAPAEINHTGQTLEDWILSQSKEWKDGSKTDGSGPKSGPDIPTVSETHH